MRSLDYHPPTLVILMHSRTIMLCFLAVYIVRGSDHESEVELLSNQVKQPKDLLPRCHNSAKRAASVFTLATLLILFKRGALVKFIKVIIRNNEIFVKLPLLAASISRGNLPWNSKPNTTTSSNADAKENLNKSDQHIEVRPELATISVQTKLCHNMNSSYSITAAAIFTVGILCTICMTIFCAFKRVKPRQF